MSYCISSSDKEKCYEVGKKLVDLYHSRKDHMQVCNGKQKDFISISKNFGLLSATTVCIY